MGCAQETLVGKVLKSFNNYGWLAHTGVAIATENILPSANITEALETCPLHKLEGWNTDLEMTLSVKTRLSCLSQGVQPMELHPCQIHL